MSASRCCRLRLGQGLAQFLEEQRHAIGPVDDRLDNLVRQRLLADHAAHQRRAVASIEPAERQHRDVRLSGPWRHKFGPERDEDQDAQRSEPSQR